MTESDKTSAKGWWSWPVAVGGWLACAFMCLFVTIGLEAYPEAYDLFLPAILFILFANILVYLFVTTRLAAQPVRLLKAVSEICLAELFLLGSIYLLGCYCVGS